MFEIGDIIICGNNGVCKVEDVGMLKASDASKDKLYYTLHPYYSIGSKIYTPVDSQKIIMRSILTKEQVMQIISDIQNIDVLWINDEKKRELEYRNAIRKCDCRELIKIIKTTYARKKERVADGKKITAIDEKYFKMAEDRLYGEFAIPLGMTKEDAKCYVEEYVIPNIQ